MMPVLGKGMKGQQSLKLEYFYASATKHLGIGMSVGFDTTFKKVQNVFI